MPVNNMLKLISELGTSGLISLLEYYERFISSENGIYGYYESWELQIFEQNIMQLISILTPETNQPVSKMPLNEAIRFTIEDLTRQLDARKPEALLHRPN
jgi:hypothetical protein